MRWLLHVVVVVALAIGGVVGQQVRASALPPEAQVFIDEGLALLPDLDCGSFVLSERLVSERLQVTTFFNNEGEAIRLLITINFTGIITRSDTGATFVDRVAGTDVVHLVDGTFASAGSKIKIHIPGRGIVALTAGRQVRDASGQIIFSAGPADVDTFDPIALCVGPGVTAILCPRARAGRGDLRCLSECWPANWEQAVPVVTGAVRCDLVVRGPDAAPK